MQSLDTGLSSNAGFSGSPKAQPGNCIMPKIYRLVNANDSLCKEAGAEGMGTGAYYLDSNSSSILYSSLTLAGYIFL